jgi:hypothetical protein
MNYYLCVPDDSNRPCLLVTCWAEGDRFASVQDAEQAIAWDERHGLRPEIARAARGLLNTRQAANRRGCRMAGPGNLADGRNEGGDVR